MKKKILSLILTFAMLSVPMSVSAQTYHGEDGWTVSFDGSSMKSNFSSTDMDEVIYDMQPGDTAVFQVALVNRHSKAADWYMSNEIVQSMEDSTDASGGAYEYLLSYTDANGEETVIFSSEMVGGEDTENGEGLHTVSEALGEMFYLSRLESNASAKVRLEVSLDGETQGNAYQDQLARTAMQFAAEEAAEDEMITITERIPGETKIVQGPGRRAATVRTGDESPMLLYISLAALAAGLIVLILGVRKMRGDQEEQAEYAADRMTGRSAQRADRRKRRGSRREDR